MEGRHFGTPKFTRNHGVIFISGDHPNMLVGYYKAVCDTGEENGKIVCC